MVSYEHNNEPPGVIKSKEFLDHLSDFCILMDSAPWSWMRTHTTHNQSLVQTSDCQREICGAKSAEGCAIA